jgi:preprotein translocase subunit SecY
MSLVIEPGWQFVALTMATMTAGSCFVMWIGEQITERGIGNGSSLIIMSGIIANFPQAILITVQRIIDDEMTLLTGALLLAVILVSTGLIVWIERAQRRIPIQYAKRIVGRRGGHGAQASHLPLRLNNAGVIPPIFASSVMMAPGFLLGQVQGNPFVTALQASLMPGAWLYDFVYIGLIVFFAYFYTAMIFNPMDVADNLKRHGANIPGIRPGKQTAEYIDYLLTRLTGAGSLYLALVCILPTILMSQLNVPFYFGGTSLLIVVGVSLDLVNQIEAQMLTRHYDGISSPQNSGPGVGRRRLLVDAAQGGL